MRSCGALDQGNRTPNMAISINESDTYISAGKHVHTLVLQWLKIFMRSCTHTNRNPNTGLWRAVKILEGILHPPEGGWGDTPYIVVRRPETTPSVPVAVAPVTVTPVPVSSNSETDTTAGWWPAMVTFESLEVVTVHMASGSSKSTCILPLGQ